MMNALNFPGGNKILDRMFRKADGVVWDLMTGKIGIQTSQGIASLSGEGDEAQIVQNVMDDFSVALPAFAQSTPVTNINVGDIIYRGRNDSIAFVISKTETEPGKPKFRTMNVHGETSAWVPPKVSMLGFDSGVMVLRSLITMLPGGDKGLGQMQGMLLPMLMSGMTDESDLDKMLPMMLMMGGMGGAENGGMGQMMQMMLMMKMLGGDKDGGPRFLNNGNGRKNPFHQG